MRRRIILSGAGVLALGGAGAGFAALSRARSMRDYDLSVAEGRDRLPEQPGLRDLIRFAILAPSGHNTQPWHFRVRQDRIDILPDLTRRTPVVDPDDHHLFVGLGCAAENLALAAGAHGHAGSLAFEPAGDGAIAFTAGDGPESDPALIYGIIRRQSTRVEFDGTPVDADDLRTLANAAGMPGVDVCLITDRRDMERVRDLVVAGTTAQMGDPAFVRELKAWLRYNPRDAMQAGDGLFSVASGSPALPDWLGNLAFDLAFDAASESDRYSRQIRSSAGVAVFVSRNADRRHWVDVGRACQRFALQATALGLKHSFINQPVEVASLRPELAALVGLPGRRPDIVMRFGRGPKLPFSARRPVQAVMV